MEDSFIRKDWAINGVDFEFSFTSEYTDMLRTLGRFNQQTVHEHFEVLEAIMIDIKGFHARFGQLPIKDDMFFDQNFQTYRIIDRYIQADRILYVINPGT